jgi:hypothetical protein
MTSFNNALVVLPGVKNTLDSDTVFQRTVENQDILEAGYAPHAHFGELSLVHFERSHSRHLGEVLKGLLGGTPETARDFDASLLGEKKQSGESDRVWRQAA